MKFQVFSDLHLENYSNHTFKCFEPITPILFLAGDIGHIEEDLYKKFMDYVSENWEYVYVVLGNHEFYNDYYADTEYKYSYEELFDMYEDFFLEYSNIVLVTEGNEYKINDNYTDGEDIYIIGGTGFPKLECSDDSLIVGYHDYDHFYKQIFNDFRCIWQDKDKKMTIKYFNELADMSKTLLLESIQELSKQKDKKVILFTHFPYGLQSLTSSSKYHNDSELKKAYFCNNITETINKIIVDNVNILIAGHTHYSYNFTYNNNKYISNQMGYSSDRDSCFDEKEVYVI